MKDKLATIADRIIDLAILMNDPEVEIISIDLSIIDYEPTILMRSKPFKKIFPTYKIETLSNSPQYRLYTRLGKVRISAIVDREDI